MTSRRTAMLVVTALLSMQTAVWAAPPPSKFVTNRTRFRIPFKVEAAALQRLNPRELQLYISRDLGATWEQDQTISPNDSKDGSKFEYQANTDGEYWFAVKILDGRGQLHPPPGQYDKGLVVVVDTTAPLLDLSLRQLPSGKIQLSWSAADANLDASTLKIEYLQPGNQDWESVDVTPKSSGEISWNIAGQGKVSVRGTIADTATNVGLGKTQLVIAVGDPPPKLKPKRRQPIAEVDEPEQKQALAAPPLSPPGSTVAEAPPPAKAQPAKTPLAKAETPEPSRAVEPPVAQDFRGPVITPFGTGDFATDDRDGAISGHTVSSPSGNRPEITRNRWGNESEPATRISSQRRTVNSRRFQVGYAIDDVGPSGISSVELFITQDQGRKWWKYGDDPDRRSPFDVEVPQDGEYGFSIRARSGTGTILDPPVPGEPPAVIVAVDQTPPAVEILSAVQGQGANSHRVQIRWRVADEHLASKPVCVYYSTNRNGPWESLSGWKDDSGGFEWTITPGSPPQIYLRVVARDTAGNMGKAETAQALVVDLSRPTARIVDVESPQANGPQ